MIKTMGFSAALNSMKKGNKVTRQSWNGTMWLAKFRPKNGEPMTRPFIYLCTTTNDTEPWQPSQWDLFTNDWIEYSD